MSNKNDRIAEILHGITQKEYSVTFSNDFAGMITISYSEDHGDFNEHEHINYPGGSMKDLEKKIVNSLADFLYNKLETENTK